MDAAKPIPLFGLDQEGVSSFVTAQRHLNLRAIIKREADKAKIVFVGTSGTTLFSSVNGDTPIRGWLAVGSVFYYVHRGTFYEMNNAGTRTSRGTLNTTTGRVDMAYDGTRIVIVDGTNGYTYTIATTTLAQIASGNFPNGARTVTWLDGYFLVDDGADDEFFVSTDGTTWNALDFATAESAPDGLSRVFSDNGEIVLFGSNTTEFWANLGGGAFPFAPVRGATQEFGLAARWSVAKFNSGLAALVKNNQGQVQVMWFEGYVPRPISSQELDTIINGYSSVSDATAFAYMENGAPCYQINFPTAGKSWLYDAASGMWSPLEYGLSGARHRAEMFLDFNSRRLVADYSTGDILQFDDSTYTDNGTAIAREIIGRHVFQGSNRVTVDELFADFEVGVGLTSGQGVNPQVMLAISKDGGKTFGTELWKSLGAIGKYATRVAWRRLGIGRDFVFKLRLTDPCKFVLTYAAMRAR